MNKKDGYPGNHQMKKTTMIGIDGTDGSSKSTQARLLYDWLSIDMKREAELVQMPGSTSLGQELRRLAKSRKYPTDVVAERLIFMADTVQFISEFKARKDKPEFVIFDRFSPITDLVYSSTAGLSLEWMGRLQDITCPDRYSLDLLMVFDIPFEVAHERKVAMSHPHLPQTKQPDEGCRIESKGDEFMRKVSSSYSDMAAESLFKAQGAVLWRMTRERAKKVERIDATQGITEIRDAIRQKISAYL